MNKIIVFVIALALQQAYADVHIQAPMVNMPTHTEQQQLPTNIGLTTRIKSWFKSLSTTTQYSWFWFNESRSIMNGIWDISQLSLNKVTFIGSARTQPHEYFYQQAYELAHMLAEHNIAVISGGGSGIMQAAAAGTRKYQNRAVLLSLGIGVEGLERQESNFNQLFTRAKNFEIRQWLLFNFSCAIVAFPGGIGTLYELSQVLTLIDTKQMAPMQIILFGKEHWQPLINWFRLLITEKKLISPNLVDMLYITDSVSDAFAYIQQSCQAHATKYAINLLI